MSETFKTILNDNQDLAELSRAVHGQSDKINSYKIHTAMSFGDATFEFDKYKTIKISPTGDGSCLALVPPAGAVCHLIIISQAGVNEYNFDASKFTTAGIIATAAAKTNTISFISDGTKLIEISRIESI